MSCIVISNQEYLITFSFPTFRKSPVTKKVSHITQSKSLYDTHMKKSSRRMRTLNSGEDLDDHRMLLQHVLKDFNFGRILQQTTRTVFFQLVQTFLLHKFTSDKQSSAVLRIAEEKFSPAIIVKWNEKEIRKNLNHSNLFHI